MIRRGVSATDAIGLVMEVLRRVLRMHNNALDVRRAEMENARFPVIDPDDGVIVMSGHVLEFLRSGSTDRLNGMDDICLVQAMAFDPSQMFF